MNTPVICDTSGLLAYFNGRDPDHERARRAMADLDGTLVLSPFVLAELDYLIATRLGVNAELALIDEVASGAFELPLITASDLRRMREVIGKYADQQIGLADASLVVLAHQYETHHLLTLDHRHFGVVRALDGARFELLPTG